MWNSLAYSRDYVNDHPNTSITFIGHSKGGAEAAANAVATKKNAILFNPATVNLSAYELDSSNYSASMTAYIVEGEILNYIFGYISGPIDKVEYLPEVYPINTWNPKANIENAVKNHSMETVKISIIKWEEEK